MAEFDESRLSTFFSFWGHLSPEEKELALRRQAKLTFAPGQHIRGGNVDCLGLIYVLQGVLRAYLLSPDGREVTLYRIKQGDTCVLSASCILDAISFETHVDAEEETQALLIPADCYAALMKGNVHVELDSYKMASMRFSEVVAGLERLSFYSLEQRLAAFLLDESTDAGEDTVSMTHEQIAQSISSAREAVGRVLKGMAKRGLVELKRGGVRLMDKPSLYRLIG